MSDLRFMEKLLDGVEVEMKPLGDVSEKIFSGGTPSTKVSEYWENGTVPWMSSGEVNLKVVKKTEKYISEAGLNNSSAKIVPENSIVIALAGQGKTRGKVARTKIELTTNQSLAALTYDNNKINTNYVFHFLETQYKNLRQISSGNSGRGGLNLQMISSYKIPIPCPDNPEKSLKIQSEIVSILDTFTELTTELTAELTARKKQYHYYRDRLLSFDEGTTENTENTERSKVEWKTLGEVVATIKTGKLNASAMVENGKYPFFTCDANPFKIDTYAFDTEAIIVSGNGSQVGHINYYKGKFNAYQRTYILADCSDEITLGFLLTYLKAYLRPYIMQHSKKGSVPYITMPMLQNFKVPVPSFEMQAEITSILGKFDTLTTSITEGLPREIELRQKQYEYYRDLLLSFPKPEVEA